MSLEDHRRQALAASKVRPRKFDPTKHAFISVALTKRPNLKFIAEYCRTPVAMIEQHYGRFLASRVDDQLALLAGPSRAPVPRRQVAKTATREAGLQFRPKNHCGSKASPSIASLNRTLTGFSLNQVVAWVREMDGLRRALAA